MSVHVGANALHKAAGGRGVLLGGVPGVTPGKVVILGAGVSGSHAAEMALGLRADVTVMDLSLPKLAETDQFFRGAGEDPLFHQRRDRRRDRRSRSGDRCGAGAWAPRRPSWSPARCCPP
jgi:threonine dehydrogenase-like Zn-dependent dehydrogenase